MPMLNDNTGFEFFTLDFPWTPYPGHFLVRGANSLVEAVVVFSAYAGHTCSTGDSNWPAATCSRVLHYLLRCAFCSTA
jgi:hypothetical protein